jgi:hypothetical protein
MKQMPRAVALAVFCMAGSLLAADPFAGTWKLNLNKSANPPANPVPNEVILEEQGGNAVVTARIAVEGRTTIRRYSYPLKGGPVTFIEGVPPPNVSEERKRISDRLIEEVEKRDGKIFASVRYSLDEQGKTLTLQGKWTDAQSNKTIEYSVVYDRQ